MKFKGSSTTGPRNSLMKSDEVQRFQHNRPQKQPLQATAWRYRIPYVKHFLRTRGPRNSLMKFDNLMKFDSLMKFDILSKVPAQQAPETA